MSVTPYPTSIRHLLTDRVAQASEEHADALARHNASHQLVALQAAAIDSAALGDEQAARDAVAGGEQPPARTTPEAAESHDKAMRAAAAAERLARESQHALLGATLDDRDELLAIIADRSAQLRRTAAPHLNALVPMLRECGAIDELRTAISDPTALMGDGAELQPAKRRRRPHDHAEAPLAPVLQALGAPGIDDDAAAAA